MTFFGSHNDVILMTYLVHCNAFLKAGLYNMLKQYIENKKYRNGQQLTKIDKNSGASRKKLQILTYPKEE